MDASVKNVKSPLFSGIGREDMEGMLGCIGYHVRQFQKGEIIAFEEETINHVGVVMEGAVDMIKEDVWGNRTMLLRSYKEDIFGETFACGEDSLSVVTFVAAQDSKVLFLSFCRVMHTCTHACIFHQTLIENMVRIIAGTLVEVGLDLKNPDSIPELFGGRREQCGPTLPAKGLCLNPAMM